MPSKKLTVRDYERQNLFLTLMVFLPFALIVMLIIPAKSFQLGGTIISRVATDEKVVAITFDDGPTPEHTDELIATLKKSDIPATFFLIGVEIERHPESARKLVESGYEIGNHGYHHNSLVFKPSRVIAREIEETDKIIRAQGYTGPIAVRPPYGHKLVGLPNYLAKHGRPTVMWNIAPDKNDPSQPSQEIVKNVTNRIQPGSIIVMHGMYNHNAPSRQAISQIVVELRSRGYRFVSLSQLLTYR